MRVWKNRPAILQQNSRAIAGALLVFGLSLAAAPLLRERMPHPLQQPPPPPHSSSGADISSVQAAEARGIKYSDNGVQKDILQILKDHGFNYIRLRVFVDPTKATPRPAILTARVL